MQRMIAGFDCGTTFTKVVWKKDNEYQFASTKDTRLENILYEIKKGGIKELHVTGMGYTALLDEQLKYRGFTIKKSDELVLGDRIMDEILLQAEGAKELLRLDCTILDEFLLVGIGSGTSYAFVTKECTTKYPLGNPIGGEFMRGLARLFGVDSYHELIARASVGTPLDLRLKDVGDKTLSGFEGDLVIANFGNTIALFDSDTRTNNKTLNDVCTSIVHCVAVATIRDVMLAPCALDRNITIPQDVVYVGSTIAHNAVLRKMLEEYTEKIGKISHIPSHADFATALGAYNRIYDAKLQ